MTVLERYEVLAKLPAASAYLNLHHKESPTSEEIETASQILTQAPVSASPYDVAKYLSGIEERNSDGELYVEEWKIRSNPVIVSFFGAISNTDPYDHDKTPWCAAFVNWCYSRSGRTGTSSASSGSFRCAGDAAAVPTVGDIAVFKRPGDDDDCRGRGHVAFVENETADYIRILGGNQSDMIRSSTYPRRPPTGSPYPHYLGCRDWQSIE